MYRKMNSQADISAAIAGPVKNHKELKMQSPRTLWRLKSDEQLIALTRKGNEQAFNLLVQRYRAKLLVFCRQIVFSKEDAEDVLQETFTAAYHAIMTDERKIIVQPWLYRIARNRSLNHLRKKHINGNEELELEASEHGTSTADKANAKERFHELITDIQSLPETQRTALLLREMEELSYQEIADTMDTSTASVKSLLVRARISLAEAAQSRKLDCEQVREELAHIAEGLQKMTPPVKKHLKTCKNCANFHKHLKATNRTLALALPIGPLLTAKKVFAATVGSTTIGGAASGGSGAAISSSGVGAAASSIATGSSTLIGAGLGAAATKTAAGFVAAAVIAVGTFEAKQTLTHQHQKHVASQQQTANVTPLRTPPAEDIPTHNSAQQPKSQNETKPSPAKSDTHQTPPPATTEPVPTQTDAPVNEVPPEYVPAGGENSAATATSQTSTEDSPVTSDSTTALPTPENPTPPVATTPTPPTTPTPEPSTQDSTQPPAPEGPVDKDDGTVGPYDLP